MKHLERALWLSACFTRWARGRRRNSKSNPARHEYCGELAIQRDIHDFGDDSADDSWQHQSIG